MKKKTTLPAGRKKGNEEKRVSTLQVFKLPNGHQNQIVLWRKCGGSGKKKKRFPETEISAERKIRRGQENNLTQNAVFSAARAIQTGGWKKKL